MLSGSYELPAPRQNASDSAGGVDPPIYFVGFKNPVTGLLREISKEAQAAAHDIAKRLSLRRQS